MQCSQDRHPDHPAPPDRQNLVALYQERAWHKSRRTPPRVGRGTECVLVKTLMGTITHVKVGVERVNVLDLSRRQFDATTVCYFVCEPIGAGIGRPVAGFEMARA
jgi:hypothetical protein